MVFDSSKSYSREITLTEISSLLFNPVLFSRLVQPESQLTQYLEYLKEKKEKRGDTSISSSTNSDHFGREDDAYIITKYQRVVQNSSSLVTPIPRKRPSSRMGHK